MRNNKLGIPGKKAAQSGVTLFEVLAAMVIGAIVTAGLVGVVNDSLDDIKGQQAASYQSKVAEAAASYVRARYQTLTALAGPIAVTTESLISQRFLDASFTPTNVYSQAPCLLIRTVNQQPQAILVTEGGLPIPDKQLAYIATLSQNGGSVVREGTAKILLGAFGNWRIPLLDFNSQKCGASGTNENHLATLVSWGSSSLGAGMGAGTSDFLYRNNVGNPDANKMTTALDMGTSDIKNAGKITGTDAKFADVTAANISSVGNLSASTLFVTPFSAPTCTAAQKDLYARHPTTHELYWCDGTKWKAMEDFAKLRPSGATLGQSCTSKGELSEPSDLIAIDMVLDRILVCSPEMNNPPNYPLIWQTVGKRAEYRIIEVNHTQHDDSLPGCPPNAPPSRSAAPGTSGKCRLDDNLTFMSAACDRQENAIFGTTMCADGNYVGINRKTDGGGGWEGQCHDGFGKPVPWGWMQVICVKY
jgi:prepilin-type N-terminal cleavage/methylation domain-containing protein